LGRFFYIATELGSVVVHDLGGYTFTVGTALSDRARRIDSRISAIKSMLRLGRSSASRSLGAWSTGSPT
jgi:hypothetical protein